MHLPTRLSDLTGIATPADAPPTIRFSAALTGIFEAQRRRSFPGSEPKEQGGTIVANAEGNFSVQHIGGYLSDSQSFAPNLWTDFKKFSVVGIFHTHPYGKVDHWMNGVSLSGGDIVHLINFRYLLSVVQSGPRLFAALRTRKTPNWTNVDVHKQVSVAIDLRTFDGQPFQQASRIEARDAAAHYGLAYYQGGHGILTRI